MMQCNEFNGAFDDYNDYQQQNIVVGQDFGSAQVESVSIDTTGGNVNDLVESTRIESNAASIDFNDPNIARLPRILLMGPRRGGKTSIQVSVMKN